MSTLEAKLREHFEQVAGSEQPPGRVSIAAASRRGRTLLRWRRAWLAGTPVLAASAVVAVALAGTLPASEHRAGSHRPVSRKPAQVRVAPNSFSPLTPYASFGWLPAGELLASGGNGAAADYLNAYAGKHFTWQLWTYAAGACQLTSVTELGCSFGDQTESYPLAGRSPSVNGHRAFWLSAGSPARASRQHQAVVWQYAANGWAELTNANSGHQPGEAVLRIAAHVIFGGGHQQPVEFAAQLSVPRAWHATADHFVVERGVLLAQQYSFTARGSNPGDLPSMTTSAGGGSCYFYPDGQSVRRVINGYRVVVNTIPAADGRPATYQVCVADADGLMVFISVDGDHPVISPVTLFRHMKLLGADPANWTADPTR